MLPKQFKFTVENTRTGESTKFIGQGNSVAEAIKDGLACVEATFRPKNDGKKRDSVSLGVFTKDGQFVKRTLSEFESDGVEPEISF
jgi:hypothetical protein